MTNLNQPIEATKLKIKQTVSQLVEIDKDINLPYFFRDKNAHGYYKIISKELAMAVYNYPGLKVSVELKESVNHFLDNSIEITEEQFETAKASALTKIQNIQL